MCSSDLNADGAVNPYLAATLVLAAGLEGVREKLDPGKAQRSEERRVGKECRSRWAP